MRKVRVLLMVLTLAAGGLAVGVPTAFAQSTSTTPARITWSLNCDNRSSPDCTAQAVGLGGFWGSVSVTPTSASGGVINGQATDCNHLPGTQAGAQHMPVVNLPYSIMTSEQIGPGTFLTGTDPNDEYIVPLDFGVAFPVTPGHYSQKLAPAISAETQVN